MRKQQTHIKLKRKEFLLSIARHLVTPFATQRYKFCTLSINIKEAIILCEFALYFHGSTLRNIENYSDTLKKRGPCHLCDKERNLKPS